MTREEIHEIANTIDPNVGKEIDEDYNCADVYDFTIGFECGAKFIKEKMADKVCDILWVMLYEQDDNDVVKVSSWEYDNLEDFMLAFRRKLEE